MHRKVLMVLLLIVGGMSLPADDAFPLSLVKRDVDSGTLAPDGTTVLAVTEVASGGYELATYTIAGKKLRTIVRTPFLASARMNPGGTRIVMHGEAGKGATSSLLVVNADGSGLKPFPSPGGTDIEDRNPWWSTDGSQIAWSRNGEVWIASTDGSGARALLRKTGQSYTTILDWLDRTLLVATSRFSGDDYHVGLLDAGTGSLKPTGLVSDNGIFADSTDWILYGNGPLRQWDVLEDTEDTDYLEISPSFMGAVWYSRSADFSRILMETVDPDVTWAHHLYLLDVSE